MRGDPVTGFCKVCAPCFLRALRNKDVFFLDFNTLTT